MQPANWRWFLAIVDWDWHDPRRLDWLLQNDEPRLLWEQSRGLAQLAALAPDEWTHRGTLVPAPLRSAVQAILAGTRQRKKQNTVNAANIRGADRMYIAAEISYRVGLVDVNKFNAGRISERAGEMHQRKQGAVNKQDRETVFADARALLTFEAVNNEALKDLVRELRQYARQWPNI